MAGATISADGKYRYALWRDWGTGGRVCWVMLNPSTADAEVDDPTIRRCMGFARDWGYGGIIVVNLYGFRATKPDALRAESEIGGDPVGPENDETIKEVVRSALTGMIVCGWGAHPIAKDRASDVYNILGQRGHSPKCLRVTASGAPGHPLYIPKSAGLCDFLRPDGRVAGT